MRLLVFALAYVAPASRIKTNYRHDIISEEELGSAFEEPVDDQVLMEGDITDHDFEPHAFKPWKCNHVFANGSVCGQDFSRHVHITKAQVAKAVGAIAAKEPVPQKVLSSTSDDWSLWIGNMFAASNKVAMKTWIGETGGAVVTAAEGLDEYNPAWAKNVAKRTSEGMIAERIQLALKDTPFETRVCAELKRALTFIDAQRAAKRNVLIHCVQGKHRSAAITVGYLMFREGKTLDEAISIVQSERSITEVKGNFYDQLKECQP